MAQPTNPQNPHHHTDAARVKVSVITVSDTRTAANDTSGDAVAALITQAGHDLHGRHLVKDSQAALSTLLAQLIADSAIDAVICTGGTGIAPRDITPETVRALLDVELEGFGEAFRRISYDQIGAKAILSRAIAGRAQRTIIFALPGSTAACNTGVTQCVLPILPHAVGLAQGGTRRADSDEK